MPISIKEEVKEYFDEHASVYETGAGLGHINHPGWLYFRRQFYRLILPFIPNAGQILEVGCGTGAFTGLWASKAKQVVGVDISQEMLRHARQQHPHMWVVAADAEHLPFKEGSFDAIFGVNVFSYVEDRAKAFRECFRALSRSGYFVDADMNGRFPAWSRDRLLGRKSLLLNLRANILPNLNRLLREAGFQLEMSQTFSWIPYWSPSWLVALLRPVEWFIHNIPVLRDFALRVLVVARKEV
jgi:ubiquinone/menaquinone biosynthesis C-methylase UbiE